MGQPIPLSNRLKQLIKFLPDGSRFADIGSDHAYLPCYVCLYDKTATAIAGEVNHGPYQRASDTVASYKLQDQIKVRLGDGLEVIADEAVEQLVIAGMGGTLIQAILENGRKRLTAVQRMIIQPNIDAMNVRKWLSSNCYKITDEIVVEEKGHVYEVIVADKQTGTLPELSERESLFGPVLLTKKPSAFVKKWNRERNKLIHIIQQMKQASVQNTAKISDFETRLQWIEEVLHNDEHVEKY